MCPALFPVNGDLFAGMTQDADTTAAVKAGGDPERSDRFARLLFSTQDQPVQRPRKLGEGDEVPPSRLMSALPLSASFPTSDGEEQQDEAEQVEGEAVVGAMSLFPGLEPALSAQGDVPPDTQVTLFAPAAPAAPLEYVLPNGPVEPSDPAAYPSAAPAETADPVAYPHAAVPEVDRKGDTGLWPLGERNSERSEGKITLPAGFERASYDPEVRELISRLRDPVPLAEDFPRRMDASPSQAERREDLLPPSPAPAVATARAVGLLRGGIVRDTGEPAVNLPAVKVSLQGGRGDEPETSFTLSMTDNVRPRRGFAMFGTGGTETDDEPLDGIQSEEPDGEGVTERPFYIRSRLNAPSADTAPGKSADARQVTDLSAATVAERGLRAEAEAELSTNRIAEGRDRERSIFPEGRDLFGERGEQLLDRGAAARSTDRQSIPAIERRSADQPSLKGLTKDDESAKGVQRDSPDASFAAARNPHSSPRASAPFAGVATGETLLQGRGGEALEDGVQHVVRFLRSEGRQAASIIIDPPALGRIEVELVTITKGVEASIKVSSEQVRQLVQDHITVLRNHLEQQGVHLGEFVVDLRDNSKGNFGREGSGEEPRRGRIAPLSGAEETEETIPSFRMDLEHGLLYLLA